MTNTYNTGNPLGSTSPKDLYDNASNFDDAMNSPSPSFTDRFGKRRETYAGLENSVENFLLNAGYQDLGPYAGGIIFSERNQVVERDGEFYKPAAATALPYTSTGVWASESVNFVVVPRGRAYVFVDTVADLLLLPTPFVNPVFTLGYYARGDGGGSGPYYWDDASTTIANGGTILGSAPVGRIKLPFTGAISVKVFGAKMDGVTNDSVRLQAAGDFIISAGGGQLVIPNGQLYMASGVTWSGNSLHLIGEGLGASQLRCGFAAGDIICIGDGTANPNNCSVSQLSIISNIAKTGGAGVRFRNGHNLQINNVRIDTNMFIGIQLDGGPQQFGYFVEGFEISGNNTGIKIGDGTVTQDVWLNKGIIGGSTSSGLLLIHVSGLYMSNIDFIGCTQGISTFPGAGQSVGPLWAHTVLADTCTTNGWNIITNGGACFEWSMVNCWGSTNTDNGMYFAGDLRSFAITNARVINNGKTGILLVNGSDFSFNNCSVSANSQSAPNTYNGLEVGANVSQWSVMGGVFGLAGQFLYNNQKYGIFINGGTTDYLNIIGVNLLDNATGPVSDNATGSNKSMYGNIGFKTANTGTATLNSGASSVVVPHGLAVTPVAGNISITPAVDLSIVGLARYWVSAVSATDFTIQCNAAATGNAFFSWQVRAKGA